MESRLLNISKCKSAQNHSFYDTSYSLTVSIETKREQRLLSANDGMFHGKNSDNNNWQDHKNCLRSIVTRCATTILFGIRFCRNFIGGHFFFPFKEYENIRTKEIHRTEVIIKIRMGDTLTMAIAHVNVCKEIRITIK